jgi:hypothetical protein
MPLGAIRAARRLAEVADRDRMPEYAVRAAAWRRRLGDPDARPLTDHALAAVDNPALLDL